MSRRSWPILLVTLVAGLTVACAPVTPNPPVVAPTPAARPVPPLPLPTAKPVNRAEVSTPALMVPTTPTPSDNAALKPRTTPIRIPQTTQYAFEWSAKEFGVPLGVLLAVSYDESQWEAHDGEPSTAGGYGIMHLTDVTGADDPTQHTLPAAARLLDAQPDSPFHPTADDLKVDTYQNIRGGAALLAQYALQTVGKGSRDNEADWYGAIVKYAGSKDPAAGFAFANQVYATLGEGVTRTTSTGESIRLLAKTVIPNKSSAASLTLGSEAATFTPDCPPELACTAAPTLYQLRDTNNPTDIGNYELANRPDNGTTIKYIVIHDTEGSVESAVKGFQTPGNSSANYIIRSSDGSIVQMVPNEDVAFHAGNWYFNIHAIGIEHEGYAVKGATWYSEPMYQASAKLVRYLAQKYHIPLDRAHVLGHDNIPGLAEANQTQQHWDPGPFWNWDHYFELLGAPLTAGSNPQIRIINPGFDNNPHTLAASCSSSGCTDLPSQSSNFMWVRAAPDVNAPLVQDLATASLSPSAGQGTRLPQDWGDQAAMGERFFQVGTRGDWDEIYFGGQLGWLYDPGQENTLAGDGIIVRTRTDRGSLVPIYGHAFPEVQAYPPNVLPDDPSPMTYIQGGQTYVATELVSSDDYVANFQAKSASDNAVVKGKLTYYQIYFNHRFAFLRSDDVEVIQAARP